MTTLRFFIYLVRVYDIWFDSSICLITTVFVDLSSMHSIAVHFYRFLLCFVVLFGA